MLIGWLFFFHFKMSHWISNGIGDFLSSFSLLDLWLFSGFLLHWRLNFSHMWDRVKIKQTSWQIDRMVLHVWKAAMSCDLGITVLHIQTFLFDALGWCRTWQWHMEKALLAGLRLLHDKWHSMSKDFCYPSCWLPLNTLSLKREVVTQTAAGCCR